MDKETQLKALKDKLVQDLRRGLLVLATLSRLEEAKYGYSLLQELSEHGLDIEQGTLYPLLRRLEEQGLLASEWNVEGSRPRRYYRLSPDGIQVLQLLSQEWSDLVANIDALLTSPKSEDDDESN